MNLSVVWIFLLLSIPSSYHMILCGKEIHNHRKNTKEKQGTISEILSWGSSFFLLFYTILFWIFMGRDSAFSATLALFSFCQMLVTGLAVSLAFLVVDKNSRILRVLCVICIGVTSVLLVGGCISLVLKYPYNSVWQ